MMNAARSPWKKIRLITIPATASVSRAIRTIPQETKVAADPKKAGAKKAITVIRAVQGTRGARRMVSKRARSDSITREPSTAGTLQPNPRKRGRKDLP